MSEYHYGLIIGFCVGGMFTSSLLTIIYMTFKIHRIVQGSKML